MNARNNQPAAKRLIKGPGKTRETKSRAQGTEWELADERLDEALRHTFPASDALSIVQKGSRSLAASSTNENTS
jgi:hypothetical protein